MHRSSNDEPLFENLTTLGAIDLIGYVETRQNLEELEWRIAGRHGVMGGPNDTNTRLALPLDSVETIFVKYETELEEMRTLVGSLALAQSTTRHPEVLCSTGADA
jgi:hypothetical protein